MVFFIKLCYFLVFCNRTSHVLGQPVARVVVVTCIVSWFHADNHCKVYSTVGFNHETFLFIDYFSIRVLSNYSSCSLCCYRRSSPPLVGKPQCCLFRLSTCLTNANTGYPYCWFACVPQANPSTMLKTDS